MRDYCSDLIIYLDANDENLYLRKNNDKSRDRGFFEYYMKNYRVEERKYFLSLDAKVILTNDLSPSQTSQKVEQIIKSYQ